MARYSHHRRGEGERTWFLARRNAYHGVGYGIRDRDRVSGLSGGLRTDASRMLSTDAALALSSRAIRRPGSH